MSKYNLNDTVYVFNLFVPLVTEFKIKGIIEHEGIIFYSCDEKNWIQEDYLFLDKNIAYTALLKQVQTEYDENYKI